jgi:hypothetical protein
MSGFHRRYKGLLGTLDGSKKDVCADCRFVDPVSDIAILGAPDGQQVDEDEYDGYFSLTDDAAFVRIAEPVSARSRGWVLSIAGQWVRSETNAIFGMEGVSLQIDLSKAGMSGSPILDRYGRAIGLVSIGNMSDAIRDQGCKHGPNPILVVIRQNACGPKNQ